MNDSFGGEKAANQFRVESNCALAQPRSISITPPPDTPWLSAMCGSDQWRARSDFPRAGVLLLDNVHHRRAAIVTLDLINAPSEMVVQLREAIADRTKTPAKNILIATSHNHSGPGWSPESGLGPRDGRQQSRQGGHADALRSRYAG